MQFYIAVAFAYGVWGKFNNFFHHENMGWL